MICNTYIYGFHVSEQYEKSSATQLQTENVGKDKYKSHESKKIKSILLQKIENNNDGGKRLMHDIISSVMYHFI